MFFSYFPNRYCPNDERMWSCSRKFYITVAFSIISCGIPTISSLMVFLCSSKVRGQCLKMLAFKYSFPVKKKSHDLNSREQNEQEMPTASLSHTRRF